MDGKWDALANALLPNTNLYGGLASLNNFDPLVPGRFYELMTRLDKTDTRYDEAASAAHGSLPGRVFSGRSGKYTI